jgi:hypothetical protein
MIERKYIITMFGAPVIFDSSIMHSEIRIEASSAGFVRIWMDTESKKLKVHCYGESTSLGISAQHPVDAYIIEQFLNNQ